MRREKPQIWEIILKNAIVYIKGTQEQAENKVFPEVPVAMRTIRQKEFMSIVERKGVKVIL